jgi:predicted secreted acid phosphatase
VAKKPLAVIVDMDGTLVDVSAIRHHVRAGILPDGSYKRKNFDAFHTESATCPPIPLTVALVDWFRQHNLKIIIVTARSRRYRSPTVWWLLWNNIETDDLFMRRDGDHRPDYETKRDLLVEIRKRWHPIHAIDDNPNVLRLWEEEGISTTRIPGWED